MGGEASGHILGARFWKLRSIESADQQQTAKNTERLTVIQPESERVATRVDIPRFGLQASRFRGKVFVFGQPIFALLAMVALYYLTVLTGGPFLLLIPVAPFAAALNFYLYGVRFPVTLEVRDGQLVWSGLFSERSVPMHCVVGAKVHGLTATGSTVHIIGAPDMHLPMAYGEWNKFANAVNHYYPSCNLPPNKTIGKWSLQMRFFHQ